MDRDEPLAGIGLHALCVSFVAPHPARSSAMTMMEISRGTADVMNHWLAALVKPHPGPQREQRNPKSAITISNGVVLLSGADGQHKAPRRALQDQPLVLGVVHQGREVVELGIDAFGLAPGEVEVAADLRCLLHVRCANS
jgi:hypothetical protein